MLLLNSKMKKSIITIFFLAITIRSTLAQGNLNVSVDVKGISETKGKPSASNINDAVGFQSASHVFAFKATSVDSKELHFEFTKLIGQTDYAIIIFHDLIDNGVLDMQGNMPAESFGFLNNIMMWSSYGDVCSFYLEEYKWLFRFK